MKTPACGWPEIREAEESKWEMKQCWSQGQRAKGPEPLSEGGRWTPEHRERRARTSVVRRKRGLDPRSKKRELRIRPICRLGPPRGGARKDSDGRCCAAPRYICLLSPGPPHSPSSQHVRSRSLLPLPRHQLCPHSPGHGSVVATPPRPLPLSVLTTPAFSAPTFFLQPRPPLPFLSAAME